MNEYMRHLMEVTAGKEQFTLVRQEAQAFYQSHTAEECFRMALELYESDDFQIQEAGVFLCGYIGAEKQEAVDFLKNTVSCHESWKIQEILAMAFDSCCRALGYENALPMIEEWLSSDCANVRRAVTEGLRIWTGRPYFKDHPQEAVRLLSGLKEDDSEYVRRSAGNALKDISKKFPDLIREELNQWDLSSKKTAGVYKLAAKFL